VGAVGTLIQVRVTVNDFLTGERLDGALSSFSCAQP